MCSKPHDLSLPDPGSVLYRGPLELSAVGIEIRPESSFVAHPSFADRVDDVWVDIVESATRSGSKIWNSHLYRLESFESDSRSLSLSLATIETKQVLATKRVARQSRIDQVHWPLNLFVCGLVSTSDGCYLFGELSGTTLGKKGKIDLLGGALSRDERVLASGADLGAAITKELVEELGIEEQSSSNLFGLVLTEFLSVGIVLETSLPLTSQEVQACFAKSNDGELARVVEVSKPNLKEFLLRGGGYFPIVAQLLKE